MAETANIARMAEIISDEIFEEFGWKKVGPTNVNWECQDKERHDVETHPSDVVFYYDEPFKDVRTYIQTDLKSYSQTSISKSAIAKAVGSLAMQVACAEKSEEWQRRYVHSEVTYEVCGMLFVYNHDGGFDRTFSDFLEAADFSEIDLPEGSKIAVLSPENISWLHNVSQEITRMRGRQTDARLPDRELCSFFYPQPVQKIFLRSGETAAASLEVLTGPQIILKYKLQTSSAGNGYVVFHRGDGDTENDYLYLIDFIRQHELLNPANNIQVRSIDRDGTAQNNFQKAKQQYLEKMAGASGSDSMRKIISDISFSGMRAVTPHFSEIQIGMDYDR